MLRKFRVLLVLILLGSLVPPIVPSVMAESVTLKIYNVEGYRLPGPGTIKVKLYDDQYKYIGTYSARVYGGESYKSITIWGITSGKTYYFSVFYENDDSTLVAPEYWGHYSATFQSGYTYLVYRIKPIIKGYSLSKTNVNPNEEIRVSVSVYNPSSHYSATVKVYVRIDKDKRSPYDRSSYSSQATISPKSTKTFTIKLNAPNDPGDYYLHIYVKDTYTGYVTDQTSWEEKIHVISHPSLSVRVHNVKGRKLPGGGGKIEVILFDDKWQYITSKVVSFSGGESYKTVTFTNLKPNRHYGIEVYQDPKPSYLRTEFWGSTRIYVGTSSKTVDFYRNMPYFRRLKINDKEVPVQMYVGTSGTVKAEIMNPSNSKVNTKVVVYLDRDRRSSYDYSSYGTKYVSSGKSGVIKLSNFKPENAGTYYARAEVYTYIGNKWVATDNLDWIKGIEAIVVGFIEKPKDSYELFVNDTIQLRFKIEHGRYLRFIITASEEGPIQVVDIFKNGQGNPTVCLVYKSDKTYWVCDLLVVPNDVVDVIVKGVSSGTGYLNYQLAANSEDLSLVPISANSPKLFADSVTLNVIEEKVLAEGTTIIPVPITIIYDPPGDNSFAELSRSQSYQTFFSLDLKASTGSNFEAFIAGLIDAISDINITIILTLKTSATLSVGDKIKSLCFPKL